MSAPDEKATQHYATIIVVGGGCYGSYYVRQLARAIAANAITVERVLVVDRAADCAVAASLSEPFELVVAEWSAFFAGYLDSAIRDPRSAERDAIVPSPLMPHLMGDWLVDRAHGAFGDRVARQPFDHVPSVPWKRAGSDGTHYVSFATWMCPVNCVEPRTCPHTRAARDWSMPVTISKHAADERAHGTRTEDAVLFCRHRAYGVGMFDTREVLDAAARIQAAGETGAANIVIGTVSHCHGALTRLVIEPPHANVSATR